MDDSKIIELFFARSEQAISELSAKYGKLIFSISNNILKNKEDARECENDTYLSVWDVIPPQKPNPLCAFVCRIARNLSLKKYRYNNARKRNSSFDVAMEELDGCIPDGQESRMQVPSAEEEWQAKELGRAINEFIGTLEKEERILFLRRYWFCDSIGSIAAWVHLSENNVSVKLYRIREKLKEYLGEEGFDL